jgi:hypothetical protein
MYFLCSLFQTQCDRWYLVTKLLFSERISSIRNLRLKQQVNFYSIYFINEKGNNKHCLWSGIDNEPIVFYWFIVNHIIIDNLFYHILLVHCQSRHHRQFMLSYSIGSLFNHVIIDNLFYSILLVHCQSRDHWQFMLSYFIGSLSLTDHVKFMFSYSIGSLSIPDHRQCLLLPFSFSRLRWPKHDSQCMKQT